MIHTEYTWITKDKKSIFGQTWMPEVQPTCLVLILHGLNEHSGRYQELAAGFVDQGYGVVAIDFRGHGKSQGRRGHARSFEKFLMDVDVMVNFCNEHYPEVARVFYGHSLGATAAINYFLSRYFRIDGIIVSSPWIKLVHEPAGLKYLAGKILNRFWPSYQFKTGIRGEEITTDEATREKYRNDPLAHELISARVFFETREAGLRVLQNVFKINVPILCMHGKNDKITSHQACEDFVMNTSNNTSFKSWDSGSHQLHTSEKADEVFRFVLKWLKKNGL